MRLALLVLPLALVGCAVVSKQDSFLIRHADPQPTVEAVTICHGYGCRLTDVVDLSEAWPELTVAFETPAESAEAERAGIAQLMTAVENTVGNDVGTSVDVGDIFAGFTRVGPLDCIDEAANTTTILTLLENNGLLNWHEVRAPMSRGLFLNRWPHPGTVIAEHETGETYAVDSWFHANGTQAEIVSLEMWLDGWSPKVSNVEQVVVVAAEPAGFSIPPHLP